MTKIVITLTVAIALFTSFQSFAGDYSKATWEKAPSQYSKTPQSIDWRDYVDQNYQTMTDMTIIVEKRGPKWRAVYEDADGNKHRIPGKNGNLVGTKTEAEDNADDQRDEDGVDETDDVSESTNTFDPQRPSYPIPVELMTDEELEQLTDQAIESFLTGK